MFQSPLDSTYNRVKDNFRDNNLHRVGIKSFTKYESAAGGKNTGIRRILKSNQPAAGEKMLILGYSGIGFFGYLQNLVFTKGSEKLDELGEM